MTTPEPPEAPGPRRARLGGWLLLTLAGLATLLVASARLLQIHSRDPGAWARLLRWLTTGQGSSAAESMLVAPVAAASGPVAPDPLGLAFFALVEHVGLGLWLLVLGLALLVGRASWRAAPRTVRLAAPLVLLGALALRVSLASFGPGDFGVNLYETRYGSAVTWLMQALEPWTSGSPVRLVVPGLALASLVPVVLLLVVWEARRSALQAILTGGLAALLPVLVRFSGVANRQGFLWFFAALAFLGLVRYGRRREPLALLLYVVATALLLETRQEGFTVAGLTVLFSVLVLGLRRFDLRLGLATGLALLLAAARLVAELADSTSPVRSRFTLLANDWLPWLWNGAVFDPDVTSWPFVGVFALGLVAAYRENRGWFWWLVAAVIALGAPTRDYPIAGVHLANLRYQSVAFLVVAATTGIAVGAWLERQGARLAPRRGFAIVALTSAALAASLVPGLVRVSAPRTLELEYRFLAEAVQRLPADATIYTAMPEVDVPGVNPPGLAIDRVLRAFGRSGQRWLLDRGAESRVAGPSFFYHQAACASDLSHPALDAGRQRCAEALARVASRPVALAELPARPFARDTYRGATVHVGFYCNDEPVTAP